MCKKEIFEYDGKTFEYNYEIGILSWLDDDGEALDCVGVNPEDWNESHENVCEMFNEQIEEELYFETQYI